MGWNPRKWACNICQNYILWNNRLRKKEARKHFAYIRSDYPVIVLHSLLHPSSSCRHLHGRDWKWGLHCQLDLLNICGSYRLVNRALSLMHKHCSSLQHVTSLHQSAGDGFPKCPCVSARANLDWLTPFHWEINQATDSITLIAWNGLALIVTPWH
jgi:hypothetical protein